MRPNIRPAAATDLTPVAELDQTCFGPTAWSRSSWELEFERLDLDRRILVADDGMVVGYVVLLVPVALEDPVDLLRIAVAPAERRTGIAGQLMTAALASGRTTLLEVAAGNTPAIALYQQFGFTEIDRRRGYYPGEDAIILRLGENEGR